jgi:hypothetical protein
MKLPAVLPSSSDRFPAVAQTFDGIIDGDTIAFESERGLPSLTLLRRGALCGFEHIDQRQTPLYVLND